METGTFKTRVLALIQKSRKALRLYSSADTAIGAPLSQGLAVAGNSSAGASIQVGEWRELNSILLRKLTEVCQAPSNKALVHGVFSLRNEFQVMWRETEAEMAVSQRELINCSERGDFVRAATLAQELVRLKARVQAGQAVHHELDTLIKKSRVVKPVFASEGVDGDLIDAIHLLDSQVVNDEKVVTPAASRRIPVGTGNVFPLKRRSLR